ncbi:MAG: HxlR family transcriptional regulator [Microbacteriaceae bacterium]|nr:HxlR family transcriptional regulator [Microbacteriaceae bacterium]
MDDAARQNGVSLSEMDGMCSASQTAGALIRDLLDHLGDKWTLLVVGMLEAGPVRYSALKIRVPGISQRMLTLTLKKLERDGMVRRESFAEIPPRVEYELTDLGRTLLVPAVGFARWALDNANAIIEAREAYDIRD